MFDRRAVKEIDSWYRRPHRKPLVIRGARQVGKTTAVEMAAKALQVPFYKINLERHTDLEAQFSRYDIKSLLLSFSIICGESIAADSPGIVFLDEAQAIPSAYACLRYFHEDAPGLAVVLTGSLLDQVLENYGGAVPVGRVEQYFLGPVRFNEFLAATGESRLLNALTALTPQTLGALPESIHQQLLEQVRRYVLIGGLPHAVQLAIDTGFDHATINKYHIELLQTYKADFRKYRGSIDGLKLDAFFDGILAQVGRQFSHKMAHEIVEASGSDNRLLNSAIQQFIEAHLFYRVMHSAADGIPLGAEVRSRISKFLFIDVGLLLAAQGIPVQSVLGRPLELASQGILAEQFVGQHLLYAGPSYARPELFYWHPPKSELQAEVDFLMQEGRDIVPVEVKSAPTGRLRSLHSYAARKNADLAIRIHSGRAGWEEVQANIAGRTKSFKLLNLPFYLIEAVHPLVRDALYRPARDQDVSL